MTWRTLLLILILMCGEMLANVLICEPSWMLGQINKERESISAWIGYDKTMEVVKASDSVYKKYFKDSGIESMAYAVFVPTFSGFDPKNETGKRGKYFFDKIDDQLTVLWSNVYYAIQRIRLIIEWLPYMLPILLPAIIDGAMQRETKKVSYGYTSEFRYNSGHKALTLLVIIPFLYLLCPIAVSPLAVPIWALALSIVAVVMSANFQKWA